ncbi:hypothetical protein ACHAW6_011751 [Cyclotella cf. meneghiniana]
MRKAAAEREPIDELQVDLVSPVERDVTKTGNDYLDLLAKPVGSLGTLEDWVSQLASIQRSINPKADNVACLLFAADHGIAKDVVNGGMGCSAYTSSVSRKVVMGLDNGLARASVLAKCNHAGLCVIDVGLDDGISK